jgi:hypothetical protein
MSGGISLNSAEKAVEAGKAKARASVYFAQPARDLAGAARGPAAPAPAPPTPIRPRPS